MRRFDARRQLDGESIPEFESAIRSLHREAWPNATHAQRDNDLKRKFEYGVSHPDLLSHLQIHARYDNFENTVLKARHFIHAHEIACAPKKSVRIITPPLIDHDDVSIDENPALLQPLLQGFRDVMREHSPQRLLKLSIGTQVPGLTTPVTITIANHDRITGRTAAMEIRMDGTVLSLLPMAITVHPGIPVLTQGHLSTPGPLITPGLSLRQCMDTSPSVLITISFGHRRLDHIEDSLSHIGLSPIDLSHLDPDASLDLRLHHDGTTGDPRLLLLTGLTVVLLLHQLDIMHHASTTTLDTRLIPHTDHPRRISLHTADVSSQDVSPVEPMAATLTYTYLEPRTTPHPPRVLPPPRTPL